jgi:hypothetical protein
MENIYTNQAKNTRLWKRQIYLLSDAPVFTEFYKKKYSKSKNAKLRVLFLFTTIEEEIGATGFSFYLLPNLEFW